MCSICCDCRISGHLYMLTSLKDYVRVVLCGLQCFFIFIFMGTWPHLVKLLSQYMRDYIRWCHQTLSAESADVWSTASLNNIALKNSINEDFPIAFLDVRVLAVLQETVLMCMCVLSGVNVMLRKIAVAAASKPSVEITQDGETLSIKTSTSVRTTHVTFTVGQEFNEATVDGRPCTVYTHPYKNTSNVILHLSICVFLFQNVQKNKNHMKGLCL